MSARPRRRARTSWRSRLRSGARRLSSHGLLALATWLALSFILLGQQLFTEAPSPGLLAPGPPWRRGLALAALVGAAVLFLWRYLKRVAPKVYAQTKLMALLALLLLLGLTATAFLRWTLSLQYLLVIPAITLMSGVLLGASVGLGVAVVASALVGLLVGEHLGIFLVTLGASLAALYCASGIWPLYRLMRTAVIMAGSNLFLVLAVGLLGSNGWLLLGREALLAGVYGGTAAALALGGIFLLQRPFGIATYPWLLELSHPDEPLLRRFREGAPGSYYASLFVASLAHQATEAVGADALLARVGALYHDVGKLRRPAFFAENQPLLRSGNVHDRLSAPLSSLVITSHVRDGVELARQHKLPPQVADIIAEHHGTTLVSYFYHRALTHGAGAQASESQFRYPGPRPRSPEAAIVMLADSAQAAAQTLAGPSAGALASLVRNLVRDRVEDGQLDECDLTVRQLAVISESLVKMLHAMASPGRVEYPQSLPPKGSARANGRNHSQSAETAPGPAAAEASPRRRLSA